MQKDFLDFVAQVIFDKKGSNILCLDVRKSSSITDYVIIAEGNVDRHVISIARALIEEVEKRGKKLLRMEGIQTGDWVVLDFGDLMIHLFYPGLREKYSLEKLWDQSELVELHIDTSKSLINS